MDETSAPAASRANGSASPATGLDALSTGILATVVAVGGIAPLATDMYVPAFPQVAADLAISATEVQLTLTTFFVGMALGQLIGGPISDQRGRRVPLIASLVVLVLSSLVCAWSPAIGVLLVARSVQGFAGGWAMVIARAVVVDLASGLHLVRSLNVVAGVGGVAPIVGPLLGGVLLMAWPWQASFFVVAGLAALMTVAVVMTVPETLPPERRHAGGLGQILHATGSVLRRPRFVAYLVVMAFSMGVTFAYVATSAFILQSMNGLSPIQYSLDFALNAVGLAFATLLAGRLAGKVPTRRVIGVGLVATAAAGLLLLVGAVQGMPLWWALAGFFVLMCAQGLIGPNAGALASHEVPEHPGTGSAVLGFLQWCMAGVIAPIAGLGGDRTAVPMAVIILVLTGVSFGALALTRSSRSTASAVSHPPFERNPHA